MPLRSTHCLKIVQAGGANSKTTLNSLEMALCPQYHLLARGHSNMNNLLRLAYSYRSRASQLRKIATVDSSSQTAELLLTVADNYDEKAAAAEAIERNHHGSL
jgi:hypothetical protein